MKQEQVIELMKQNGFSEMIIGDLEDGLCVQLVAREIAKIASLVEQTTLDRAAEAVSRVPVDICTYEALSAGYAAILNLAKEPQ